MNLERWLDYVFFAGLEVSVLSIPALVILLFATPQGPISLAALTAVCALTCAVGTLRGGWFDSRDWPPPGDPYTIPVRSAYYSATIAGAAYLGSAGLVALDTPVAGIAIAALVSVVGAAALPRVLGGVASLADRLQSV
ncbi:hypothetical protein [Halorussus lipolyticus]|uniref:hypothetical protein n=1 Tax=Halorussus lipolyticus TaxID=3034024 RepID=UPI0023E878ED|nr:hypothetical protein [Halorussus sp. DT80]